MISSKILPQRFWQQTWIPLFLALMALVLSFQSRPLFAQFIGAEPFTNGVVSSADIRASQAGVEIMQRGGNAIDAAVAVQFALAVTTPRAGNLGGGGFMVYRNTKGEVFTLDFREKAPAMAKKTMYQDDDGNVLSEASKIGGLASGVPGSVDGMISALERYGSLPLEVVMEPAIRIASQGFTLNHIQAADLNAHAELFEQFDASSTIFIRGDGRAWKTGDLFIQEDLAQTLTRIASLGRDGFYAGPTAAAVVREMRRQ
ncbi:MAG: gamma-glutamyltransferase, partial [Bacteroidetes bacterium]